MRQRRGTGWSPSGRQFPSGYSRDRVADDFVDEIREDQKGSPGYCWCGERYPHDWPGKGAGEPHPRESS